MDNLRRTRAELEKKRQEAQDELNQVLQGMTFETSAD